MLRKLLPTSLLVVAMVAGGPAPAFGHDDGKSTAPAAITAPVMGWNSWNRFGCNISETLIRQTADAIIANNLHVLGYKYVNIDDCWMASTRDSQGRLQPHPTRFPSGIKALADYVHARGLKLGIYSSAGTHTCQGYPASLDHEVIDAQTFAAWGVDLLKYDNCYNQGRPSYQRYKAMGDALKATGRQIVYSICNWGAESPWNWATQVGGDYWRTTGDITDRWSSVLSLLDQQVGLEAFARQGAYNDPDMLEVGNGGMTTTEYISHFSLWALLSSPMLLGNDLRSMSSTTLSIIRNAEVIAVNQDWGGSQGRKIRDHGDQEVWAKPMSDGSVAVVLFNRGSATATMSTTAAELGLGGSSSYNLRNLWTGATSSTTGTISASVPSHGSVTYRVFRAGTLAAPPAAGTHQLGSMPWLTSSNGWGPAERNMSNGEQAAGDGRTLTINGTTYSHGIGAHADSAVHIYLGRACSQFTAQVGVDDEVSAGSVRFQVYGDGRLLGYTEVKTASQGPTSLSLATSGYAALELRVTDGRDGIGSDHADWGAATITCGSAGTVVYRDDFEAAAGWQANPNGTDTATTGRFERSDPEATVFNGATYQQGTTTSGVNALVTGASGGDVGANDIDGGTTSIQSPAITLPTGASLTLSFRHYLSHLDNATSADYLRVRVIHSGGSTVVFTQAGSATNVPAAWQSGSVDLTPYAGQSIRIVVEAADADTGSLVEAAVDDITITRQ